MKDRESERNEEGIRRGSERSVGAFKYSSSRRPGPLCYSSKFSLITEDHISI